MQSALVMKRQEPTPGIPRTAWNRTGDKDVLRTSPIQYAHLPVFLGFAQEKNVKKGAAGRV